MTSKKKLNEIRRNLLNAISAAMEVHEELIPDHGKYESFLEDMVPQTEGFRVDQEKFRNFHEVLYFMLIGTFGVDGSDGKSQANVCAHLTNRETHPSPFITEIPYLHKLRESDPVELAGVLRLANLKAMSANKEAQQVNEMVESMLRELGGRNRRLRRAKGCTREGCRRGLIEADYDTRKNFKSTCTEFQRNHLYLEPYPDNDSLRVLCPDCQTQQRQDELDAEENAP